MVSQRRYQAEHNARLEADARAQEAISKLANVAAVKKEARGTIITLSGSVLFASGRSALLPTAREKLDQVAEALKTSQDHQITIQGYTDSRGSDQKNQDLSLKRAQAVRDYLTQRGVPPDKLKAEGMGSANPIDSNDTTEGRANNRRVEIVVKPLADEQSPDETQSGQGSQGGSGQGFPHSSPPSSQPSKPPSTQSPR
jgi:outer membrane protein OmpA-like peptidoglycan-associated protein